MSFLNDVILPNKDINIIPLKSEGGFLSNVVLPQNQEEANKIADLKSQSQVANINAEYADSFKGTVKNIFSDIGNKIYNLGKTAYSAIISPLKSAEEAGKETAQGIKEKNPAKIIAGGLGIGTSAVSGMSAPISAITAVAEKIPVLKEAVNILNIPFEATGITGGFLADKFTDALPISKENKDILKPALHEVGSLAGQIWLGGKIIETLTKKGTIEKTEIDNLKKEAKIIPPEPPPPPGNPSIIKSENKGTILAPAESAGKILKSKLAAGVEANAIEKKLTKGLKDLPEYNQVNMKEQADFAINFLKDNPDEAMRVAMGEELPPHHILPEAIFTAVENKALNENNIEVLKKLAVESNLSTQATAMGQRIRALGERQDNSSVKIIQDVKIAREAKFKNIEKVKQTTIDEIKSEIKKSVSQRPTWEEFINSIKCNY